MLTWKRCFHPKLDLTDFKLYASIRHSEDLHKHKKAVLKEIMGTFLVWQKLSVVFFEDTGSGHNT